MTVIGDAIADRAIPVPVYSVFAFMYWAPLTPP